MPIVSTTDVVQNTDSTREVAKNGTCVVTYLLAHHTIDATLTQA